MGKPLVPDAATVARVGRENERTQPRTAGNLPDASTSYALGRDSAFTSWAPTATPWAFACRGGPSKWALFSWAMGSAVPVAGARGAGAEGGEAAPGTGGAPSGGSRL